MSDKKHGHYFKDVAHLKTLDVYRVLDLFHVTNPCVQHAIKKLLLPGGRGAGKGMEKDIQEAIDSLQRALEMHNEDGVKVHDWNTFEAFQTMKRNAALPYGDVNGDAARKWLAEMQAAQPKQIRGDLLVMGTFSGAEAALAQGVDLVPAPNATTCTVEKVTQVMNRADVGFEVAKRALIQSDGSIETAVLRIKNHLVT